MRCLDLRRRRLGDASRLHKVHGERFFIAAAIRFQLPHQRIAQLRRAEIVFDLIAAVKQKPQQLRHARFLTEQQQIVRLDLQGQQLLVSLFAAKRVIDLAGLLQKRRVQRKERGKIGIRL